MEQSMCPAQDSSGAGQLAHRGAALGLFRRAAGVPSWRPLPPAKLGAAWQGLLLDLPLAQAVPALEPPRIPAEYSLR
jgi:hypothetical protein